MLAQAALAPKDSLRAPSRGIGRIPTIAPVYNNYKHVHMHIHIHVFVCVSASASASVSVSASASVSVCLCVYIYIYICIHLFYLNPYLYNRALLRVSGGLCPFEVFKKRHAWAASHASAALLCSDPKVPSASAGCVVAERAWVPVITSVKPVFDTHAHVACICVCTSATTCHELYKHKAQKASLIVVLKLLYSLQKAYRCFLETSGVGRGVGGGGRAQPSRRTPHC